MTLTEPAPMAPPGVAPDPLGDGDLASLLMIRHFEWKLLDLFAEGKLNGTTHTCLGQEYVPVSLDPMLAAGDFVFSNHRGHGHYLARFADPAGLLAEITGREGAVCGGVGGSQHIFRDSYLSTGIQGESLPVAAGAALHFKRAGLPHIAVVYIGDGTWGEGSVYEALNIARLWELPLLVVVENNGISQTTPNSVNMAGTIAGRARAFDVDHHRVTGNDVRRIRAELAPLIDRVRHQHQPLVVEFDTVRLGPHSKGDDTRPERDIESARARDWYGALRAEDPERFDRHDREQRELIARVAADVLARPLVAGETA
ncbi:thiamine pyrophosphate-dependent dehydrogenase E1 component subunit alpha [Streptomyces sp. NPDC051183]|uniref:thiamine pyrophosphate-dependent dehydrogenase E1 component subunit alpha n=1 Tax=unclassified Streptomyces TaxID=2593676 RepID=UPI003419AD02